MVEYRGSAIDRRSDQQIARAQARAERRKVYEALPASERKIIEEAAQKAQDDWYSSWGIDGGHVPPIEEYIDLEMQKR